MDVITAPIKDALSVPFGSGDVKVSRVLEVGRPIRDECARQALGPFALALRGILGPGGFLTLQEAGTKLRGIPGFLEAMAGQRLAGIVAIPRSLDFSGVCHRGKSPQGVGEVNLVERGTQAPLSHLAPRGSHAGLSRRRRAQSQLPSSRGESHGTSSAFPCVSTRWATPLLICRRPNSG